MRSYRDALIGGAGSALVGFAVGLAWWQTLLVVLPTVIAVVIHFGSTEVSDDR